LFHKLNNLKQKTLVTEFTDYPDIRLTLDYQEDYWLLLFILKQTGPESTRDDILNLFIRNPDLREFNLFRNNDWIVNQNLQRAEFENASV
jgi:spore coat polysaccharide biosynthesis protein SpsF (cytidylyltransferase family)